MPTYFEVDAVNAHIPRLTVLFERVLQLRAQIKGLAASAGSGTKATIAVASDRDHNAARALAATLDDNVDEINLSGCVIKDIEIGLVDWPALHEGRKILLCWRFGEREVGYWHEVDGGYRGRHPVAELDEAEANQIR
jgi:hypothetical protein